jgi:hypothetical protein
MKKLTNRIFAATLLSVLTACGEQGVKLQVEPTLPVPVLVVPDHGTNSNDSQNIYPNNNQINNQNTYPNNNQNDPYQYNNPSQQHKDHHRKQHQRNNGGTVNSNQQPDNTNDQQDYRNTN